MVSKCTLHNRHFAHMPYLAYTLFIRSSKEVRVVEEKEIIWVGDSKKHLCGFPEDVKDEMGYALQLAQEGDKHPNAKLFKLHGESGIYEIVSNFNTDTFRAVYAIKIDERLYILHAFKKKSKSGIKTPQPDIDLINKRLNMAKSISKNLEKKIYQSGAQYA